MLSSLRFIFVAFVVSQQVFCLYVRIQAKLNNNRTPIETKNVLSGLLNSQLQNQDMIKNLASSFLSTQSTVMEYDLKQAKNMNGGILFNMAFMWFLHFKMGQTQPLFFQTVQGLTNLVFNPLFQCYVLGRNLERPFKVGALANVPVEEPETVSMTEGPVIEAILKEEVIEDATDEDEGNDDDDADDDDADGTFCETKMSLARNSRKSLHIYS
jgi:Phosphate transport (Pho88)